VVLFFLSTVPSIMTNYTVLFDYMEAVSVYIFMVELGLRFWCIIEKSKFKKRGPIKGVHITLFCSLVHTPGWHLTYLDASCQVDFCF
jgi:hypothetical protein